MRGRGGFGLFWVSVSLAVGVSVTIGACDGRVPLNPGGGSAGSTPSGSGAGTGGTAPVSSSWGENGPTGVGGAVDPGTAVVGEHGVGGANGGTGTTPPADAGPATGPRSCSQLESDYVAAVAAAKACDPASSVPQCALYVIPALCIGGCSTTVNDTALPYAVREAWDAIPCPVTPMCAGFSPPPSHCPTTHVARCLPSSDGTGHCVDVTP